jgi:hypothetical protein
MSQASENDWKPADTAPEGVEVWARIDDADGVRNEAMAAMPVAGS